LLCLYGVKNIKISGIRFEGMGPSTVANTYYCALISLMGATVENVEISGCQIVNAPSHGISQKDGPKQNVGLYVHDCLFTNVGNRAHSPLGMDGAAISGIGGNSRIVNNLMLDVLRGVEYEGSDWQVRGGLVAQNEIRYFSDGLIVYPTDGHSTNFCDITFANNTLFGTSSFAGITSNRYPHYGVWIEGGQRLQVIGNHINGYGLDGILAWAGASALLDCVIDGNAVWGPVSGFDGSLDQYGIYCGDYTYSCTNLVVQNNTVADGYADIYVGGSDASKVLNNTVRGATIGIQIAADANRLVVRGNVIQDNAYGFTAADATTGMVFSANRIWNSSIIDINALGTAPIIETPGFTYNGSWGSITGVNFSSTATGITYGASSGGASNVTIGFAPPSYVARTTDVASADNLRVMKSGDTSTNQNFVGPLSVQDISISGRFKADSTNSTTTLNIATFGLGQAGAAFKSGNNWLLNEGNADTLTASNSSAYPQDYQFRFNINSASTGSITATLGGDSASFSWTGTGLYTFALSPRNTNNLTIAYTATAGQCSFSTASGLVKQSLGTNNGYIAGNWTVQSNILAGSISTPGPLQSPTITAMVNTDAYLVAQLATKVPTSTYAVADSTTNYVRRTGETNNLGSLLVNTLNIGNDGIRFSGVASGYVYWDDSKEISFEEQTFYDVGGSGHFFTGDLTAKRFIGNASGLTNLPITADGATVTQTSTGTHISVTGGSFTTNSFTSGDGTVSITSTGGVMNLAVTPGAGDTDAGFDAVSSSWASAVSGFIGSSGSFLKVESDLATTRTNIVAASNVAARALAQAQAPDASTITNTLPAGVLGTTISRTVGGLSTTGSVSSGTYLFTNADTFFVGKLNGTNGFGITHNLTNYWFLLSP
jgi:hypothetical protein